VAQNPLCPFPLPLTSLALKGAEMRKPSGYIWKRVTMVSRSSHLNLTIHFHCGPVDQAHSGLPIPLWKLTQLFTQFFSSLGRHCKYSWLQRQHVQVHEATGSLMFAGPHTDMKEHMAPELRAHHQEWLPTTEAHCTDSFLFGWQKVVFKIFLSVHFVLL
jgi:hypothetical protein